MLDGTHRCHALATCHADPTSKNGYSCRCKAGYKGNGNIQIHPFWTQVHNETDEAFFENLAQEISRNSSLHREFGVVPGEGIDTITLALLNFNKNHFEFAAGGGARGCIDIDECALARHPKNTNKIPLCPATQKCSNTIGSFTCVDSYENFCELGLHDCHALADCHAGPKGTFCKCRNGFVAQNGIGNGQDPCWDINECTQLGIDPCNFATEVCVNTIGSFICVDAGEFDAIPTQMSIPPTMPPTTIPNNGIFCDKDGPYWKAVQDYEEAAEFWKEQEAAQTQRGMSSELSLILHHDCALQTCNERGVCVPRTRNSVTESICICNHGFGGIECEEQQLGNGLTTTPRQKIFLISNIKCSKPHLKSLI